MKETKHIKTIHILDCPHLSQNKLYSNDTKEKFHASVNTIKCLQIIIIYAAKRNILYYSIYYKTHKAQKPEVSRSPFKIHKWNKI